MSLPTNFFIGRGAALDIAGQAWLDTYVGGYSQNTYHNWTVPDDVKRISVVCVGGGGGSSTGYTNGSGGGGGGLAYRTMDVTPGMVFEFYIGSGGSGSAGNPSTFGYNLATQYRCGADGGAYQGAGGGILIGDGGGTGGSGGSGSNSGAGGAGGYSGNGGNGGAGGGTNGSAGTGGGGGGGYGQASGSAGGAGGGVGLLGQGSNGAGGTSSSRRGKGGSYSTELLFPNYPTSWPVQAGIYGGGGSAGGSSSQYPGGTGARGGIRVVWGKGREFPAYCPDVTP